MSVELREIRIALEFDHDGRLILVDGLLVGVLVKLSQIHDELRGHWYLETGYGALKSEQCTFADLDAATEWVVKRMHPAAKS
jgi:hypothetical protein